MSRDVAVVLSGGGVNGVLIELGFLQRLRASELWPRVGWIFGTSAGALAGSMAAADRLDDLERFMLSLRPEETFRPNRLWRLPLLGLHEYALPRTVAERLGDPVAIARSAAASPVEVVVVATDLTRGAAEFELVYSSRSTPPETMAQAVFASAAISALVPPLTVDGHIVTDGSWVRNFPLGHAYDHPEVRVIAAFRYVPQYPEPDLEGLTRLRRRLERFARVPPVRAFVAELEEAERRSERGEPAHLAETIARLARVTVSRNTELEERVAGEKDRSLDELAALRADVEELAREHVRPRSDRERLLAAIGERFSQAQFPFRHDRHVPRITVRASAGELALDTGLRTHRPWTEEAKRLLIRRGYDLAGAELAAAGYS